MLYNTVLDVFIGLVFIYLLYSLLATVLQELIASRFGLRGRMLQKALRRMLEDGDNDVSNYAVVNYFTEAGENMNRFFKPIKDTEKLIRSFYNHPSIKYLGEGKLFKKPSYLHAHNFSQTIIHLLRGPAYDGRTSNESELIRDELKNNTLGINPETLNHLKFLFADARGDSYVFKHKLEDWFEETMERTSGWYKKQTQIILICIGFVLACMFNVDSIAISKILMKDKKAREQLVEMAISKQNAYGVILDSVKTTVIKKETKAGDSVIITTDSIIYVKPSGSFLDSVKKTLMNDAADVQGILGLSGMTDAGDTTNCLNAIEMAIASEADPGKRDKMEKNRNKSLKECLKESKRQSVYQKHLGVKILGWLITALAISLGAPFWFDLLNKLVKLRESGPKAGNQSAIDNRSISPGANPVTDNNRSEIRG